MDHSVTAQYEVHLNALRDLLDEQDLPGTAALVGDLSPEILALVLARLEIKNASVTFRLIDKDRALEVFELLDSPLQGEIVRTLRDDEVTAIFADLDPDDRVALLDELPAKITRQLMAGLSAGDHATTTYILGYPPDSVGRRMTTQMVALRRTLNLSGALDRVQQDLATAETVYVLPVIGDARELLGVVHLRTLIDASLAAETTVEDLTVDSVSLAATSSVEDAARLFADTGAIAIPVVDGESRLVGMLTVDDALRVIEAEDDEDIARAGATEPLRGAYLSLPIGRVFRARVVWLSVLALSALLTVQVLDAFEDELAQVVTLALFIPLLIGIGGNTGNQAATTVTRAIALGDVAWRDLGRVLRREMAVGFTLGLCLGAAGFALASPVVGADIGLVIGLSILSICTLAASVGGIMPLIGKQLRIDPAVFSNPFITTFVDAVGLLVYFLIAKAVLGL